MHALAHAWVYYLIYIVGILRTTADIVGEHRFDGLAVGTDCFGAEQVDEVAVDAGVFAHLGLGLVVGVEDGDAALLQKGADEALAAAYAACNAENVFIRIEELKS